MTKDFVKPGAVVIDVGINTMTDEALAARLYPEGHARLGRFRERGSMLMMNTLKAARGRTERR